MTTRAILSHGSRQARLLATVGVAMALPAGLDAGDSPTFRPVRIVACRARHFVAFLKALTLPQILDLVRHVIVLGVPGGGQGSVIIFQRFAGPVSEGWSFVPKGVAVTLRAQIELSVPCQAGRLHDRMAGIGLVLCGVECDMFSTRTVTVFARYPANKAVGPVPVARAGDMVEPRIVALHAPHRGIAAKIS
jgi:hypothetical protein